VRVLDFVQKIDDAYEINYALHDNIRERSISRQQEQYNMKTSKYITSVTLNDNHNPGQIITLNVHQIDGGYIGIDSNFIEEVANYIINPYVEDDMVQIVDPENSGRKS
jgi:hypothetical protein